MARKLSWTLGDENDVEPYTGDKPPGVRRIGPEDLDVVFQPIVDLRTRKQLAVEALTRCRLPQYSSPVTLFQQASLAGSCGRLGRAIRDVTFDRCAGIPVFVNVHPDELSARWLVRPDDPICFHDARVYIEVTESAAFEYFDLVAGALREVTARTGAFTVIDDFGAGYSNLKRISDLEPDIVKLDRLLIRGLPDSRRQRVLVRGVIELCVDIGAEVVAEGIETEDELRAVIDVGAQYGQGYLLAKPGYPIPEIRWPWP